MRTKFLKVTDSCTELFYLIIQFQESDKEYLDKCGQSCRLKIIINLSDKPVSCFSGYDLDDRRGNTIANLTKLMETNGTINGLKEIIHNTVDISHLPDELDVEEARWAYIHTNLNQDIDDSLNEIIENVCSDRNYGITLNKYIFKRIDHEYTILIVEKESNKVIYENTFISANPSKIYNKYLWIPIEEISDIDFIKFYEGNKGVQKIEV